MIRKWVSAFRNSLRFQVLALLMVLVFATSIWSALINLTGDTPDFAAWGEGWLQNFSTEMSGAIVTFGLFEMIIGVREKRMAAENKRKDDQIEAIVELMRMKSPEDQAPILRKMKDKGLLRGARLKSFTLHYAQLDRADMQEINLAKADLGKATFFRSNLENADLSYVINLEGADFRHANLKGANLHKANLSEANFEGCILPDGTTWESGRSLQEFTSNPD